MFIIGLLMAGLIAPMQVQLEARDRRRTFDGIERVVEALYGFALTNRRLPCPDTDGDGLSNPVYTGISDALCTSDSGFIPWAELAVEPGDAWGNKLTYRVTSPEFTRPSQDTMCNGDGAELDLCTLGNININSRGDNPATAGTTEGKFLLAPSIVVNNVVAVVLSHGRNGYGATAVDGNLRPAVPASNVDEAENADGTANVIYFSRIYTQEQGGCADDSNEATPLCEFDDIVVPVSRTVLNSRMVAAGQLP